MKTFERIFVQKSDLCSNIGIMINGGVIKYKWLNPSLTSTSLIISIYIAPLLASFIAGWDSVYKCRSSLMPICPSSITVIFGPVAALG